MANPKASEQMKTLWKRCEKAGAILGITKSHANRHWSCCLKAAWGSAEWFGSFPVDIERGLKDAYSHCLLTKAKRDREMAASSRRRQESREDAKRRAPKKPEEQTVEDRIKMAMWLIRRCGSVELAQDALDRAAAALE